MLEIAGRFLRERAGDAGDPGRPVRAVISSRVTNGWVEQVRCVVDMSSMQVQADYRQPERDAEKGECARLRRGRARDNASTT